MMLNYIFWACSVSILHGPAIALLTSRNLDTVQTREDKQFPNNIIPGCYFGASGALEPLPFIGQKSVSLPGGPADLGRKFNDTLIGDVAVPVMTSGYGKHASSQLAYLRMMMPKIMEGVKDGTVIFDLGSADGMNSRELLRSIKKNTSKFTIALVDLPANDWLTTRKVLLPLVDEIYPKDVFAQKNQFIPEEIDPERRFRSKAVLIGRSFYERVAADASVNVFFSGTAVQYLSETNEEDQTELAARDWLTFLRHRAKELVPGGSLHVTGLTGLVPGVKPGYVWTVLNTTLDEAVSMHMLSLKDRLNFRWIGYPRTEWEWREPFENGQVPLLRLKSFKVVMMDSPYWSQAEGDACEFVKLYVPSVMAWISEYISHTLGDPVLKLFHTNLKEAVSRHPSNFKHDFRQAVMHIQKIDHTTPAFAGKMHV